ncbi:histidine phosphatase family protein [Solibacillus sp. MA9]|uniref:Histidine phosphatase family protein n=1 Tax=Solibacillus palustris TaxID=2908203 RepID=A0ABS9UAT8_9BACL|nr:histidine phosphatase family protein [Solibacillus sp. MA9]MCH7321461.1 histidine phosphatase family protein [Solibacillus sp. MA9]
MTIVYFVRHAHSVYTPDEYKRPISEAGRVEAIKLVELFETIDVQAMYASSYLRAVQTIEPIAETKNLSITQIEALNERLLSNPPVENFDEAIIKVWENPHFFYPGGESNIDAQNRAVPVFRELLKQHENEVIVIGTHGNILTLMLQAFDHQYGFDFWKGLAMPDVIKAEFLHNQLVTVEKVVIT